MSDLFEKVSSPNWRTDVLSKVSNGLYPETLVDPSGKILRRLDVEPGIDIKDVIDNLPSVMLVGTTPVDNPGEVGRKNAVLALGNIVEQNYLDKESEVFGEDGHKLDGSNLVEITDTRTFRTMNATFDIDIVTPGNQFNFEMPASVDDEKIVLGGRITTLRVGDKTQQMSEDTHRFAQQNVEYLPRGLKNIDAYYNPPQFTDIRMDFEVKAVYVPQS